MMLQLDRFVDREIEEDTDKIFGNLLSWHRNLSTKHLLRCIGCIVLTPIFSEINSTHTQWVM